MQPRIGAPSEVVELVTRRTHGRYVEPEVALSAPRRADPERRLDEAASILAVTLLDMWRRERRARREAASGGAS